MRHFRVDRKLFVIHGHLDEIASQTISLEEGLISESISARRQKGDTRNLIVYS